MRFIAMYDTDLTVTVTLKQGTNAVDVCFDNIAVLQLHSDGDIIRYTLSDTDCEYLRSKGIQTEGKDHKWFIKMFN